MDAIRIRQAGTLCILIGEEYSAADRKITRTLGGKAKRSPIPMASVLSLECSKATFSTIAGRIL